MAQYLDFNQIKDSCSNLTSLASSFESTSDSMTTSIGNIKEPNWGGAAANSFRDKITTLVNHLPDAKRQLALSVLFLTSCANGYEALGNESVNKLKELVGGQKYIDSYDVSNAPIIDLNSRYKGATNAIEEPQATTSTGTPRSDAPASGGTSSRGTGGSSSYGGSSGYGGGSSYSTIGTDLGTSIAGLTTGTITGLTDSELKGKEIAIPADIKQGGYTVTGYDYWIKSGREMVWAEGTNQKKVSEIWKKQGSVFKNGIAVINVDGVDRYLVAVTTKFGMPGDCIDIKLENGDTIPCIIGDSKGSDAGSEWGHVLGDGKINVLEFEVQRSKYLESGNPTTEKWNLPWDSTSAVTSIKNTGSIIGATETQNTLRTIDPGIRRADATGTDTTTANG